MALVFRSYNLGFKNGAAAAKAATAAQIQGYFKEYKDLLFKNQVEWFYADNDELAELLVEYFETASKKQGDVQKFAEDLQSEAVAIRNDFENRMGKKVQLKGTPLFRIDGATVEAGELEGVIKERLGEAALRKG